MLVPVGVFQYPVSHDLVYLCPVIQYLVLSIHQFSVSYQDGVLYTCLTEDPICAIDDLQYPIEVSTYLSAAKTIVFFIPPTL